MFGVLDSTELDITVDVANLDDTALIDQLRAVEQQRRRLEAVTAATVGEIDRRKVWAGDGHVSLRGFLRTTLKWSGPQLTACTQTARLLHDHPHVTDELATGRIGIDQTRVLAKARAHPRCGHRLGEFLPLLLHDARTLSFNQFVTCVERWRQLGDPDGADQHADDTHQGRTATTSIFDGVFRLDSRGGTIAGTAMDEILQRFCDTEFDKDWAWTQQHHGPAACAALMPRTDAQRRFDALHAIFEAAVSTPAGATAPDPVVLLITDQDTFAMALARAFGITPVDPQTVPFWQRRCETSTGHPVAPTELVIAALLGHVQRVVVDSASVVIDMGRRSRLFTGSARAAAHFLKPTCVWPGCEHPAARCETDHHHEWNHHGPTAPRNGGPACRHHNRYKQNHGYRIERDHRGGYHTYRPDGTELC